MSNAVVVTGRFVNADGSLASFSSGNLVRLLTSSVEPLGTVTTDVAGILTLNLTPGHRYALLFAGGTRVKFAIGAQSNGGRFSDFITP